MAIFDLFKALAQVASERRAVRGRETAAIDPGTGERAFADDPRPLPLDAVPGGFMTDVLRASQGRLTAADAAKLGSPKAAGLDRRELDDLLEQRALPLKEAVLRQQIEGSKALAQRRGQLARPGASGAITPKDQLRRLQTL